MTTKALTKKRAEQAALKTVKTVTITLDATEEVLQRLAALLTYSDPSKPLPELADLGPLPFDARPTVENPQPLELDYNLIRKTILAKLEPYKNKYDLDAAKDVLMKHGGYRIRDVPEENLLGLLAEIEAAIE